MGTVYRKQVTRKLPKNAKIVVRKGVQIAKWKSRNGTLKTAPIVEGKDGALRIKTESAKYVAKYRDGQGVVREVSTGCRDKQAAQSVLRELERRAELVKADVMSSDQAAIAEYQSTPLLEHMNLYIESLQAKGTNADRVKTTRKRLQESAAGSKFRRLADLNLDKLESWLRKNVSDQGRSASVYNGYVELWIAFGHWLAGKRMTGKSWHWNGDKRILANPFDGMGRLDTKQDRRRVARSLTEAELVRLLKAARERPLMEAMTVRRGPNKGKPVARVSADRRAKLEKLGIARALIYKTAVLTGLRANEMRTLRVSDLSFGDVPFVKLQSQHEKNRSGSTIPLRTDLASELKQWIKGRSRDELVFVVPQGLLRIMNRDLAAAGISKTDADGCVVHVHGLRTTFGTHLSAAGVAPRVAQAAMRHSDIKLTMGTYTDARLLDTAGAVEALPSLPRTVAPVVAPNLGDSSTPETTGDNGQEINVGAPIEKSTGESSVFAALLESG